MGKYFIWYAHVHVVLTSLLGRKHLIVSVHVRTAYMHIRRSYMDTTFISYIPTSSIVYEQLSLDLDIGDDTL